jgi:hypothetical protein
VGRHLVDSFPAEDPDGKIVWIHKYMPVTTVRTRAGRVAAPASLAFFRTARGDEVFELGKGIYRVRGSRVILRSDAADAP